MSTFFINKWDGSDSHYFDSENQTENDNHNVRDYDMHKFEKKTKDENLSNDDVYEDDEQDILIDENDDDKKLLEFLKSIEEDNKEYLAEKHQDALDCIDGKDGDIKISESAIRIFSSYRVDIGKDCAKDSLKELIKNLNLLSKVLSINSSIAKNFSSLEDEVEMEAIAYELQLNDFGRSRVRAIKNLKRNLKRLKHIRQSISSLLMLSRGMKFNPSSAKFLSSTISQNINLLKSTLTHNYKTLSRYSNLSKNFNIPNSHTSRNLKTVNLGKKLKNTINLKRNSRKGTSLKKIKSGEANSFNNDKKTERSNLYASNSIIPKSIVPTVSLISNVIKGTTIVLIASALIVKNIKLKSEGKKDHNNEYNREPLIKKREEPLIKKNEGKIDSKINFEGSTSKLALSIHSVQRATTIVTFVKTTTTTDIQLGKSQIQHSNPVSKLSSVGTTQTKGGGISLNN